MQFIQEPVRWAGNVLKATCHSHDGLVVCTRCDAMSPDAVPLMYSSGSSGSSV